MLLVVVSEKYDSESHIPHRWDMHHKISYKGNTHS